MPSTTTTRVQIFGQIYHLRGREGPEHVQRVAEIVDRKMNFIADHGASTDSYRVAVLSALDIADELVRLRGEYEETKAELAALGVEKRRLEDEVERLRSENARLERQASERRETAAKADRISRLLAELDAEEDQQRGDSPAALFPAGD